ncbi:hypothetical protein [Lysinibacillus antri]|uniref:Uncharacterized protein n=1 Tax=Lysinibacillus antri TaxID=2498145 RepID=A0A3S0RY94_9BACI|nr:hypothetical protein [Lysinibacillus antri]RUL57110.1 hypothetical protein EK386_01440 [Lysinibacillus antri]
MEKFFEMEYRGLNILDEISVVELAINLELQTIHVLDQHQVVEPEYDFSTKKFRESEGFINMTKVLYDKYFLRKNMDEDLGNWVKRMKWIFYGSKQWIFQMENGNVKEVIKKTEIDHQGVNDHDFYRKYIERIL